MSTITTGGSGNWSSTTPNAPWPGGTLPTNADDVVIANTHTVTLDSTTAAALTITVNTGGTLQAIGDTSWLLTIERGLTQQTGSTVSLDMSSDVTKTGELILNNVRAAAASNYRFYATGTATVILKGFPKTRWTTLAADMDVGATTATVAAATGWQTGDKIVFATTQAYNATPRVDLSTGTNTVSGTSLSNLTATTYAHASGGYVGNFSSNMVVRPNTAGDATAVVLEQNGTTRTGYERTITDVEFRGLGAATFPSYGLAFTASSVGADGTGTVTPYTRVGNNAFYDSRSFAALMFQNMSTPVPRDNNIFYCPSLGANGSSIFGGSLGYCGDDTDAVIFRSTGGIRGDQFPGCTFTRPKISSCTNSGSGATSYTAMELGASISISDAEIFSNNSAFRTFTGKSRITDSRIGTQYSGVATNSTVVVNAGLHDGVFTDCELQSGGTMNSGITTTIPGHKVVWANKNLDPSVQEIYGFVSNTLPMLSRDNSTYYGDSGSSLKVQTSTETGTISVPLQVFAPDTKPVAVSGFIRRSAGQTTTVTISGIGITPSVYTCSGANDTWEQFLVGATNTSGADGMFDVSVAVTSGSAGTVHIDGVSAPTPIAVNTGEFGYWYDGLPVPVIAANYVTAQDVLNVQTSELTLDGSIGKHLVAIPTNPLLTNDARLDNLNATISSRLATSGYTAPPTTAAIATAIQTLIIEGALDLQEVLRIILAASAGKTDGFVPGASGTGHLRDTADSKDRITAEYDANGNRTSVTLDAS